MKVARTFGSLDWKWNSWIAVIVCGSLLQVGCQETQTNSKQRRTKAAVAGEQDNVAKALQYLEQMDEYDEKSAHAQSAYQLNRWLDSQKPDSGWKPDEFVSRLPRAVRERGVIEDLPRRRFDVQDVRYVQESVWMRQLSQWVVRQPLDSLFAGWLDRHRQQIGEQNAEQLGVAYRLFDWTVRNIQLDELMASPDEATAAPAAGAGEKKSDASAAEPAALRGIPGPGYQFDPSQTLLYGHGDTWQRMRIFTLLARQQGVDVVTLAFPGRTIPPRPRPWVSGVLLGDQLYLFDLRLGMPILGTEGEGAATLSEVVANPAILKNLDVGDRLSYQIAAEDITEVVALIDVVGPSLSWRVQAAEKQMIGQHRTVLTVPISALAARLRSCKGISDVYVWSVPFEANWYRLAHEKILESNPQVAAQYYLKYSMFMNRVPLVRGRIAYLRGQIETHDEQLGAKALFSQTRVSELNLNELDTNEELQRMIGVPRGERDQQKWKSQLSAFKEMLTASKQHASFWLGMCQLESGRPDAAVEWLKTRSLEPWPDGLWAPSARYNLARTYEQLGDLAEAQRLLLSDKSLQEHGNYLRARMLEKRLTAPAKP